MRFFTMICCVTFVLLCLVASPASAACPGDVNGDGKYDFEDLLILTVNFDQWQNEYVMGLREIPPFVQFLDLQAHYGEDCP